MKVRLLPLVGVNCIVPPVVARVALEPVGDLTVKPAAPRPESTTILDAPEAVSEVLLPKVRFGELM